MSRVSITIVKPLASPGVHTLKIQAMARYGRENWLQKDAEGDQQSYANLQTDRGNG